MVITGMTLNGEEVRLVPATVMMVVPAVVVPDVALTVSTRSTSLTLERLYQELQKQKRQIDCLMDESELQQARLDLLEARVAANAAKKQRL